MYNVTNPFIIYIIDGWADNTRSYSYIAGSTSSNCKLLIIQRLKLSFKNKMWKKVDNKKLKEY